jgi:hypothetical protein
VLLNTMDTLLPKPLPCTSKIADEDMEMGPINDGSCELGDQTTHSESNIGTNMDAT